MKYGQLCGQRKMAGKTANYFWDKTRDLPDQTGFNELFPELLKWDGKLPKQALYQTEPHPGMFYCVDRKCALPVAVPGSFLADRAASSSADRGHSLRSLDPPQAALPLLPKLSHVREYSIVLSRNARFLYKHHYTRKLKKCNRKMVLGSKIRKNGKKAQLCE